MAEAQVTRSFGPGASRSGAAPGRRAAGGGNADRTAVDRIGQVRAAYSEPDRDRLDRGDGTAGAARLFRTALDRPGRVLRHRCVHIRTADRRIGSAVPARAARGRYRGGRRQPADGADNTAHRRLSGGGDARLLDHRLSVHQERGVADRRIVRLHRHSARGIVRLCRCETRCTAITSMSASQRSFISRSRGFEGTRFGRAINAIRQDADAARASGIRVTLLKSQCFVIAAFVAGLAGSLYAHEVRYLAPNDFTFWKSIEILIMVVIGGVGSLPGAILGAAVVVGAARVSARNRRLPDAGVRCDPDGDDAVRRRRACRDVRNIGPAHRRLADALGARPCLGARRREAHEHRSFRRRMAAANARA